MLIQDLCIIGNRLLTIRKRLGLTQAELAEAAGLSDRAYADIERGSVNPRLETLLQICRAMHVTPDAVLTQEDAEPNTQLEELLAQLNACTPRERETALTLLRVYLDSLNR